LHFHAGGVAQTNGKRFDCVNSGFVVLNSVTIWVEVIGIVATLFVLTSFLFEQTVVIRVVNGIGAAIFVAYGVLLHAWSVSALNACLIIVHIIRLIKLYFTTRKEKAEHERHEHEAQQTSWWELYTGKK
jgi:hypothetical protein